MLCGKNIFFKRCIQSGRHCCRRTKNINQIYKLQLGKIFDWNIPNLEFDWMNTIRHSPEKSQKSNLCSANGDRLTASNIKCGNRHLYRRTTTRCRQTRRPEAIGRIPNLIEPSPCGDVSLSKDNFNWMDGWMNEWSDFFVCWIFL